MIIQLAWRNLWRNKERSALMISAIGIAVCAMLFLVAMTRGFMVSLYDSGIESLPGHIQIHHPSYLDDPVVDHRFDPNVEALVSLLEAPEIERWSARIKVPVVISSEYESRGITLLGIDANKEPQHPRHGYNLIEGDDSALRAGVEGIVLGQALANKLETRLGKRVVLMTQSGTGGLAERGIRVTGIYHSALTAREEAELYVSLQTAQTLLGLDSEVSEIALFVKDPSVLEATQLNLKEGLEPDLEILRWDEINEYLGATMKTMDQFIYIIVGVVFLTLSFALVNTLVMAIYERTPEIGLLLALGLKPKAILACLSIESMWLITLGMFMGNGLALTSLHLMGDGIDLSGVAEGLAMMGASPYLSADLSLHDWATTNALVFILGLATSVLPARKATQLDPIKALHAS